MVNKSQNIILEPIEYMLSSGSGHALSIAAKNKIQHWKQNCQKPIPPKDWDRIFLKQAFEWAKLTHDAETGHGAVLTNKDHRVIATGYNGFVRGIQDDILPNIRPEKYPFCLHAEANAILDCARRGESTQDTIIYITGEPCFNCLQLAYQAGVKEIIYGNKSSNMLNTDIDYKTNVEIFLWLVRDKLTIRHIDYTGE